MQSIRKTKKSVLNIITSSVAVVALSVLMAQGTVAAAETTSKDSGHQLAQNNSEYDTKVGVSREKMNAENKSKAPSKDSRIGAFSMVDGAMEGYYGDGEYAE